MTRVASVTAAGTCGAVKTWSGPLHPFAPCTLGMTVRTTLLEDFASLHAARDSAKHARSEVARRNLRSMRSRGPGDMGRQSSGARPARGESARFGLRRGTRRGDFRDLDVGSVAREAPALAFLLRDEVRR